MEVASFFDYLDDKTCSSVGRAARSGNLVTLQELLEKGSSHEISDNRGWFPIHEAANNGDIDCVNCLLKCTDNQIDDQTYEGETPLFLAAKEGHLGVMKLLLSESANISLCNNEEVSSLAAAVKNGNIECVELLLNHGIDVDGQDAGGWTALHEAAYTGNVKCTDLLLSSGTKVIDIQNSDGATAIFTAAQYGHLECVDLLISKQADVSLSANDGTSPLFIAAQEGFCFCVKSLLAAGTDPNITTEDGSSPLHAAGERGQADCMEALLESGADPLATTSIGITVLHLAAQEGHIACVEMLITRGVLTDVALPGNKMTPLCLASRGHPECCKLLLKAGADPNHEYEDIDLLRKTPLMTAVEDDYTECARVLLESGADINKATYTSPLIMVMQLSCKNSLELLLENGVDVNYIDRGGNTALSLAVTRLGYSMSSREPLQQLDCIKLLLKAGSDVSLLFNGKSPCMAFCDPLAPINADVVKLLLEFVSYSNEIRKICRINQSKVNWHELIRLTNSPRSLQHLSRLAIRQKLGYKQLKQINILPLPSCLKCFLQYSYL